jgi:multiple sugar transport system permease protein
MRGIISPLEFKRWGVRLGYWVVFSLLVLTTISYIFPALWMLTGALKRTLELLQFPPALLPKEPQWENYPLAWQSARLGLYYRNTLFIALGEWILSLGVSAMAAFALSKLKPAFASVWFYGFIAMLMVPGEAILVPRFLSVVNVPLLNISLLDTWWAVWLPGAVSAFNIFLFKNFFDQLPTELFDAARLDGANAWQLFVRIVLPLSKPVIAVLSIFNLIASWKSFFWPLLVLSRPDKQPIMVALQFFGKSNELNIVLAALVLASVPTVLLFIIFQKQILAGIRFSNLR